MRGQIAKGLEAQNYHEDFDNNIFTDDFHFVRSVKIKSSGIIATTLVAEFNLTLTALLNTPGILTSYPAGQKGHGLWIMTQFIFT